MAIVAFIVAKVWIIQFIFFQLPQSRCFETLANGESDWVTDWKSQHDPFNANPNRERFVIQSLLHDHNKIVST